MTREASIPEYYKCASCGKQLEVQRYLGSPSPETAKKRIHRVWEPKLPPFSLGCTCGHFTVVSPREPE